MSEGSTEAPSQAPSEGSAVGRVSSGGTPSPACARPCPRCGAPCCPCHQHGNIPVLPQPHRTQPLGHSQCSQPEFWPECSHAALLQHRFVNHPGAAGEQSAHAAHRTLRACSQRRGQRAAATRPGGKGNNAADTADAANSLSQGPCQGCPCSPAPSHSCPSTGTSQFTHGAAVP